MKFTSSLKLKLIYVFRINDAAHKGCLKVGEATCDNDNVFGLAPNSKALNESAKKRINQYTQTAGIAYDLLYTELTIYNSKYGLCSFNDKEVHSVLERSGIKKKIFDTENKANEWFITDLETVKRAIIAVKEGRESLSSAEVSHDKSPIVFRPEQREAIEKTKKQFKKGNQMLWNAKMRFGKTLSALQEVKDMDFSRTLILTHRPVVDSGWFEDFGKIFYDRRDFAYGSKNNGDSHTSLETRAKQGQCKYVYFASMQDLRGSELVGGNFDKNNEVFATAWDCIIVDEAHEGTQTDLGKAVMQELTKDKTKILRLSGTPFNLLDDFKEDEIYTWDYVMEQRAKASWDELHFGDPNPYASLPTMNIYTYDLGRLLNEFVDEDVAFNFREFFRVNDNGTFVHDKDVSAFLNLITKEDRESCYPFANEEYRNIFRHTLWMLPGVKEARAMSAMLQTHSVFQHFKVVNVAGNGDEDEESKDALVAVEEAIGKDPDATRTITLSCGRLTTGVSVKAWTAVFMLSGSYNTAASSYMQTIFRVQTPAAINGKVKEQCYVFDFAPDRTLKVIAETAKISSKTGKTSGNDRKIMGEFLNFCPIISIEGSKMNQFDVPRMLEQLKKVYVERVVRNGFEDRSLYNDELMKLNDLELQEFDDLKKIIGQTKAMPKTNQVDINNQGLTDEQYEELESLEKKSKKKGKDKQPLTEEEKQRLEELKKKKILFVGGGVGAAPVYPQVKWLHEHGVDADVIIGSKTKDMLILEKEMEAVSGNYYPCTDDGSYGHAGMVTTMVEELVEKGNKYDVCIAIGPMIMMKFVCLLTKKLEIPTVVSMNPIMVDGTGMCGACRLHVGDEIKFACVDGPEFDGHLVNFDEAMKRQQMYKTQEGRAMLKLQEGDTHHGGCGQCGGDE